METRQPTPTQPTALLLQAWHRHPDLIIVLTLTLIAAVLRLWALDVFPPGLHGDEGLTGLDAQRVQREGWIGPYVGSALGQPTGPLYWTALVTAIIGDGAYAVRFSMALLAIATVPVAYFALREMFDKTVATIGAALIVVMMWHLLYSRTAFMVISWPLFEFAVLGLLFAAMRLKTYRLYALAGAVLGLGIYSYNVYPLFIIAVALFALIVILQARQEWRSVALRFAALFFCAYMVALPLLNFAVDGKNGYFSHHKAYSLLSSPAYKEADTSGRIDILLTKTNTWLDQMLFEERPDYVDAAGTRPMLDPLTIALIVAGFGIAVSRIRQPRYQVLLVMLFLMPVAAVVSLDGGFRRSLGLLPVVVVLAALPLAYAWDRAKDADPSRAMVIRGAVGVALLVFAAINLQAYFGDAGRSGLAKWVYAEQIAEASKYVNDQPPTNYVYFYSGRWSFNYETRQYLAPMARGEDRSKEFGRRQDIDVDRSRPSLIVLLPPYIERFAEVRERYPEGQAFEKRDGPEVLFIAYHVPALNAADGTNRR